MDKKTTQNDIYYDQMSQMCLIVVGELRFKFRTHKLVLSNKSKILNLHEDGGENNIWHKNTIYEYGNNGNLDSNNIYTNR